jgi:hypothetical protein
MYMYICVYVSMYTLTHIYIHVHIHICIYGNIHIYICIYVYVYVQWDINIVVAYMRHTAKFAIFEREHNDKNVTHWPLDFPTTCFLTSGTGFSGIAGYLWSLTLGQCRLQGQVTLWLLVAPCPKVAKQSGLRGISTYTCLAILSWYQFYVKKAGYRSGTRMRKGRNWHHRI